VALTIDVYSRRGRLAARRPHAHRARRIVCRLVQTELIADRAWRSHAQLELATVEYIGWFNTARLHSVLGYLTPAEHEAAWSNRQGPSVPSSGRPNSSKQSFIALDGSHREQVVPTRWRRIQPLRRTVDRLSTTSSSGSRSAPQDLHPDRNSAFGDLKSPCRQLSALPSMSIDMTVDP
jgi:Integrase core domain